jgi:hypothetical protein
VKLLVVRCVNVLCVLLLVLPVVYLGYQASLAPVLDVNLWNGNKTGARQEYERAVLTAAMEITRAEYGEWKLQEDVRDLPTAADEAGVFRVQKFDVFGTVAGNPKLVGEPKTLIPIPIMEGLLGYRVLIIRAEDQARFSAIKTAADLQPLRLGIPATWADAGLFRHNGYSVVEEGSFDELFVRQLAGEFDYASFGANEITSVFRERAAATEGLSVESSLVLYYPFPVVFYVNPTKNMLAERLTKGLQMLQASGELKALFNRFNGDLVAQLHLQERTLITLENPLLPSELRAYQSNLLAPPN